MPTEVQAEVARLTRRTSACGRTRSCVGRHFFRGGTRPPRPLVCAFIDTLVGDGFDVESVYGHGARVLIRRRRPAIRVAASAPGIVITAGTVTRLDVGTPPVFWSSPRRDPRSAASGE